MERIKRFYELDSPNQVQSVNMQPVRKSRGPFFKKSLDFNVEIEDSICYEREGLFKNDESFKF